MDIIQVDKIGDVRVKHGARKEDVLSPGPSFPEAYVMVVDPPAHQPVIISQGDYMSRRTRAMILASLFHRIRNMTIIIQDNAIPANVIIEGKPAIVAYLSAVYGYSDEEISDIMSLSESTVQQYRSKFRRGER